MIIIIISATMSPSLAREALKCYHSKKTTEQFSHVVLFIILYNVALYFKSVGKILKCDHSNESY